MKKKEFSIAQNGINATNKKKYFIIFMSIQFSIAQNGINATNKKEIFLLFS